MRASSVERGAAKIVADVRARGDAALREWSERLDGAGRGSFAVPQREIDRGWKDTPADVKRAIRLAIRNVRAVAERQVPKPFTVRPTAGVRIDQVVQPLARVGCYVPGGRYPLPSTLIMTVVSALVAGVTEVIVACPKPSAVVLCAAREAGATSVLRIGGAQAVAALAYGTASVPRVDKIVGPGNRYVAAAKALVARRCAIDFYAGPTEIVIVAGTGTPAWIAADLIAQAEHDPDARAIFITWSRPLAQRVVKAVTRRSAGRDIVRQSLRTHGAVIVARNADEAMALANRFAPEHLVVDREGLTRRPLTAGAVFVGPYTAQAAGDYATGSNHVLPTAGAARFRGGLSAADFVRVMSVQRITRGGLARLAPTILPLARAEGLDAHAESIEIRLEPPSTMRRR